MNDRPQQEEPANWADQDRFLGLRDQRPVLEEGLGGLRRVFDSERVRIRERLEAVTGPLAERIAAASAALEDAETRLAEALARAEADPAQQRRAVRELETRQTMLYRQVRLGPGRAMERTGARRLLRDVLDETRSRYAGQVEKLPASAVILKARRSAPQVPAGQRPCDVHAEALDAVAGGLPVIGAVRRAARKFRIWTSYEVLEVPARDIVREQTLGTGLVGSGTLVDEHVAVHEKAREDLEEAWRIVRSGLDVAIDDLSGRTVTPVVGETETESPTLDVSEAREMVTGSMARARERLAGILPPYEAFVASVDDRLREEQDAVLEQLRHDLEESEKLSVRMRWERRRARNRLAGWGSGLAHRARLLGRWISRAARRVYFRAEDVTLRLARSVGVNVRSQETLLAFADLPNEQEVQERTTQLPPICRRLFSSDPLRTREMLVGREEALTTLGDIVKRWSGGRPSSVAVVGPEGSGKTTLLNCFEADLDGSIPVIRQEIAGRVRTEEELVEMASRWFELEEPAASLEALAEHLVERSPVIVVVEGGHHLMRRVIGGRRVPEAFMSLVLATRSRVLWILTMRKYPWRRMDERLQVAQYFTHTVETPFHSTSELREAILLRHRSTGLRLFFSADGVTDRKIRKLLLSQSPDAEAVQEALAQKYFESLFGATGGNMDSALFYWLGSLSADQGGERLVVTPLRRPDAAFLSRFERSYLFTLAEILNHGTLTVAEHASIFRVRAAQPSHHELPAPAPPDQDRRDVRGRCRSHAALHGEPRLLASRLVHARDDAGPLLGEAVMQPEAVQSLAELFSFGRIVAALVTLATAWLLLKILSWGLQLLSRRFSRYRLQIGRLFPVTRLIVWIGAIYLIIVGIFRPQANAVLAVTASAGLAVGLAAQEVVRNLLAGIMILFDEPFRVGDMVKVGEHYGEVTNIGMRSTRLQTFDDSTVSVPNSLMMSQAVVNSNSGSLDEMVVIDFTLPASVDVKGVKELASEAAAASPYIYLKKPVAVVVADAFDRTFLTRFSIKCYVLDVRLERVLASDILERLKEELTARGILSEAVVLGMVTSPAA